jgi:Transposase DDE domain group 1
MGEKESEPFQFTFNGFLKVAFQGSRVTSDAGLVLVRELDGRLGLETIIAAHLSDSRHGLNTQFPLPDLLRQSIYSRLAGYEDLNDAVRLSTDPTFRLIGSPKRWDRSAALPSTLHLVRDRAADREENLVGLMAVNRDMIGQAEAWDRSDRTVLDMDSSESPVHGQQEGSAYNGHFETVCYHPLFLFNDHGDCLAAKLRSGNVSSADDWEELLVPEIDRQQAEGQRVPGRRRLRPAGDLRGAGDTRRPVRHPHPGQQESGAGDRRPPVSVAGSAQPQAAHPLQEFPLRGGQLDHGATDRGKSRASRRRAVPARGLHRDESPAPQSSRRAVLQQAGHGRAMDQRGQAGRALDATIVSPLPGERSPLATEPARVQLGESVAAARAADADRHVVADQPPTAPRQDGWAADQARPVPRLLLAESHLTRRLFGSMLRRIWALPVPAG